MSRRPAGREPYPGEIVSYDPQPRLDEARQLAEAAKDGFLLRLCGYALTLEAELVVVRERAGKDYDRAVKAEAQAALFLEGLQRKSDRIAELEARLGRAAPIVEAARNLVWSKNEEGEVRLKYQQADELHALLAVLVEQEKEPQ